MIALWEDVQLDPSHTNHAVSSTWYGWVVDPRGADMNPLSESQLSATIHQSPFVAWMQEVYVVERNVSYPLLVDPVSTYSPLTDVCP